MSFCHILDDDGVRINFKFIDASGNLTSSPLGQW